MNKIKCILLLALCCCMSTALAQKRISGHVWSKIDGPVMMANVVEMDKNDRIVSATTTDINGNFSLNIKSTANKLKVSYIGYRTFEESPIGNKAVFKIELQDVSALKEVEVVVKKKVQSGGGLTIPAKEVSVAQQSLNMDEMQGLSFETADQALQGQIAGLDIVANSGNLGSGTSMRLRGVTSINGSQEPLIVVDGNILEDYSSSDLDLQDMENEEQFAQLLSVNPEDIASINVLKDASATAIWGAQGANGVIEIKTRRGKRGKTRVGFSYRFQGSWQPDGMKMLDGDSYTMMLKEAYFNPKQNSLTSDIVELSYKYDRKPYFANYNKNTDWVDKATQFGASQFYNVNVTGGGDKASFRVSAGYDHENGTVIKQKLDRFSTRMVLDYYVSDRIKFSSNFALTYTNNVKNYADILDKAYKAMPNMSVTRWEWDVDRQQFYDTHEYFRMYPAAAAYGAVSDGYTSKYLSDMVDNGNPIAIANNSWFKEQTYKITPQFELEYKLLGKSDDETQLNYTGEVFMDAFTLSSSAYYPGSLTSNSWNSDGGINITASADNKSLKFTTRHSLTFTPKFSNEDHYFTSMARMEVSTASGNSQSLRSSGISSGITDPTVEGYLRDGSTGTWNSRSMGVVATAHYSYKGKYAITFTGRADGNTRFGKDNKWGFFPGISGRWNISDEAFMKPLRGVISMLAVRPGWGIVGNVPGSEGLMYNKYAQNGSYGATGNYMDAIVPTNLRLTSLKWEKTKQWNLGFNLNLFDDLLNFDVNIYNKKTEDLLMKNVRIPSTTGFSSLEWGNVGSMKNEGWELFFNTKKIFNIGKFSTVLKFNLAQNVNSITYMDPTVLSTLNGDYTYKNEEYMARVQIGNALGGIYGFRYKGVYRFDYDHNGYFMDETKKNFYGYENTAAYAEEQGQNYTSPIARDANGQVIYDAMGNPLKMYFNYGNTGAYEFKGGDAIYEDINHDGQINELDIVYLGSSNPDINGGFGVDFNYGRWTLKSSFNFRMGNKIINMARMGAEDMRTNRNQSAAVNWRWRKNGDITQIPRAMNANAGTSYNSLASDRYVESGDYLRLNYIQLAYSFDPKKLKQYGFNNLRLSVSGNNLIFWSKYAGVDPEHPQSGYGPAIDNSQTPRSRSFTLSLSAEF